MGHYRSSWKQNSMRRSSLPWRCLMREESTSVGCSAARSWDSESFCKEKFSTHYNVARGNQEQESGFNHIDPIGDLGDACAVRLDRSYCDVEPRGRNSEEAWQKQSWRSLCRVAPSCSSLVLLSKYQPISRFSRTVHSSSFDVQAENLTSPSDSTMFNGMHDSTTTAEVPFKNLPPGKDVVKKINDILCHEGWEKALDELSVQLNPVIVSEVIKRQHNVNAAFAFFQWTKAQQDFRHTGRTYKGMLQKLINHQETKSRNLDTFLLVMNESLRNGWSPGVRIHSYLIDGYCKLGKIDAAIDHFNEMKAYNCAPNVVTYSCLIGGLMKAGRVGEGLQLLEEMEEKKCHPNVVTYSVLIHGLVKHRQLQEACKLFYRMKEQGCTPNLITYSALIDGIARSGNLEVVAQILAQMRETGCVPNLFIYGTLINFFVKAGKLQQAWDLFTELKQHGLVPNLFVYTPFLASFGKAGNWEQAQQLLVEMKSRNCPPDVVAYSALLAGLVQAGKWEEGALVLDQMEADGCEPNELTYTILIDGLVKAKQADRAEALFKKMVANGCSPTMYTHDSLKEVIAKLRLVSGRKVLFSSVSDESR